MDRKWFFKDPAFDREVAEKLGSLYEQASAGELDHWADTAKGSLALCILLDQAPRNLFRNDSKTFSTDKKALEIAQKTVSKGWHKTLSQRERNFIFLPFEHSEDLAMQEKSLALYQDMDENPDWLTYAQKHEVIIRRFGRFPHRNQVLGRESTPEEIEFLQQPGSSF
ncbi:membrane protein [Kiloniella spongiae]|uniref:Membrane protein n=2 Tax=Kiloniella spongiae TaxID=1489064 RepID=A0A0H2MKC8_9PROT|nr:membrane protein [Kiloniella spongiae]